ncbi:MAG: thioredoxin domain-containing protein [Myxococcales bacterium]|nr:thioredoxin domain-containing protein [Myxococcales bacterium]
MTRWIVALALSLPAAGLAKGKCPVDGAALPADTVVGSLDGKPITLAQVDAHDAAALCKARVEHRQQLDAIRQGALEDLIENTLLEREAKKRKLTVEALLDQVAKDAPQPSEAQAKTLYDMYAAQNQGQQIEPFEKVKGEIIDALEEKAAEEAQRSFVAELKANAKVKMSLPPLRLPVEPKGFGKGPKDAPITVVMFADYECPYCSRGASNLAEAAKAFDGKVRIVYRDYPLGFHERAVPAAIAARCAGAQGKYYEMHDLLYEHQQQLGDDNLKAYAEQLKLDLKAFEACQADPKTKAAVDEDFAAGNAVGVDGTPAFFINGIKLGGAQPPDAFIEIFKQELARKR